MTQLLDNELSIIESSVKMFMREFKTNNPDTKLDETISIHRFLAELRDEPTVLVSFTIFLAEEFLKDSQGGSNNQGDKISDVQMLDDVGADWNSNEALAKNIQKMKEKYGTGKLSNFDMDAFMSDQ